MRFPEGFPLSSLFMTGMQLIVPEKQKLAYDYRQQFKSIYQTRIKF